MKQYREFTKDESKWLRSFERVMKKAPDTLFMFVGNGIQVYPLDENGNRYMGDSGGVDGSCPHEGICTNMQTDGGDY